jgi:hypothetical protein
MNVGPIRVRTRQPPEPLRINTEVIFRDSSVRIYPAR